MSDEWTIDFLTISRRDEPPSGATLVRALEGAGCGATTYVPPKPPSSEAAATGRLRLGSYLVSEPHGYASGRLLCARHDRPVLVEMGAAALDSLGRELGADDRASLREGRLALDLRVSVRDASSGAYLAWACRTLLVVLGLTEGVGFDPATQRALGRVELAALASATDPLAHLVFHAEPRGSQAYWLHTHGLQKFGRPDLELVDVPQPYAAEGHALLGDVAGQLARGAALVAGQEIELEGVGRLVALHAPADAEHQSPFGRLRLADIPSPGTPAGGSARRLLARAALAEAMRRVEQGDAVGATEAIERMLAVDPDDCDALACKARLQLRQGQAEQAVATGELMQLRAPGDVRGALIAGQALVALGRAREAERAFTRAIDLNPDEAAAFAGRAAAYERLGQAALAASDRARAAYLREQVPTGR